MRLIVRGRSSTSRGLCRMTACRTLYNLQLRPVMEGGGGNHESPHLYDSSQQAAPALNGCGRSCLHIILIMCAPAVFVNVSSLSNNSGFGNNMSSLILLHMWGSNPCPFYRLWSSNLRIAGISMKSCRPAPPRSPSLPPSPCRMIHASVLILRWVELHWTPTSLVKPIICRWIRWTIVTLVIQINVHFLSLCLDENRKNTVLTSCLRPNGFSFLSRMVFVYIHLKKKR